MGGYASWQEVDDNLYVYEPEEADDNEEYDDIVEVEQEDGSTRHARMEYVVVDSCFDYHNERCSHNPQGRGAGVC